MTDLAGLVRLLADEHDSIELDTDGDEREVRVDGLLVAVERMRIVSKGEAGSGGFKAGVPINVPVVDLLNTVTSELIKDLLRLGVTRFQVASAAQLLHDWRRAWLASDRTPAEEAPWVETLSGWVADAEQIVDPPKTITLWGKPCPVCGDALVVVGADQKHHDPGQQKPALTFTFREHSAQLGELRCAHCGPIVQGATAAKIVLSRIAA